MKLKIQLTQAPGEMGGFYMINILPNFFYTSSSKEVILKQPLNNRLSFGLQWLGITLFIRFK